MFNPITVQLHDKSMLFNQKKKEEGGTYAAYLFYMRLRAQRLILICKPQTFNIAEQRSLTKTRKWYHS